MERIQRLGMIENFWSMGVPGPCGPCSEINYDRGPAYGEAGGPAVNDERYLEIWNLVFMQYERGEGSGKDDFPILGDLPSKSIDTGMGLERMASVLQGVDNLYEIDTSRAILDRAVELTGRAYHADPDDDVRLRVVTDHARTAVLLIGDGVTPGNEGRGYVLRRIMRRTVRAMRLLGARDPVFGALADVSITAMEPQYPALGPAAARIRAVCVAEEESFLATLQQGTKLFEQFIESRRDSSDEVPGDVAFRLHDTHGFPIELTLEMAEEKGLQVDTEGFRRLMLEQRTRAKADSKARKGGGADLSAYRDLADAVGATEFTGYAAVVSEGTRQGRARRRRPGRVGAGGQRGRAGPRPHRRSTPRAAASWPTRASSPWPGARCSRSSTCRARCAG